MKYTRTTISLPADILKAGQERAAEFRLSFSDYLARLIDLDRRGGRRILTIVATEAPFGAERRILYEGAAAQKQSRSKKRRRQSSRRPR